MNRSENYCFTTNNPEEGFTEYLLGLPDLKKAKYVTFGHEVGSECKTPHLQGFIQFSSLKSEKAVRLLLPGSHVERMKKTQEAAIAYAQKDGDWREAGVRPLTNAGKGAKVKENWDDVWEKAKEGRIEEIPAKIRFAHIKQIEHIHNKYGRQLPECPDIKLHRWQEEMFELLKEKPQERIIHLVIDPVGGAGKSTFAGWLMNKLEGVELFSGGKSIDIAYMVTTKIKIALFDFARCQDDHRPWNIVEKIKDGKVQSSKYESSMKYFPTPHVVVFTNSDIEEGKLSLDRINRIWLSESVESASSSSWIPYKK